MRQSRSFQPPQPPQPPPMPVSPRVRLIAQELQAHPENYAGLTAAEIAALLNAPTSVPNPTPQGRVPVLRSVVQAMAAITPDEALAVYSIGNGELKRDAEQAIASGDPDALAAVFAVVSNLLSDESKQRLGALVAQTMLDPAWTPTVPGPSRAQQIGIGKAQPQEVIQAQVLP